MKIMSNVILSPLFLKNKKCQAAFLLPWIAAVVSTVLILGDNMIVGNLLSVKYFKYVPAMDSKLQQWYE